MSDTPETDAAERMAFSQEQMVPTEVAQQLERERDEARAQAKKLEGAYEDATNYYARWNQLIEERDEARGEAARFRSLYYTQLGIDGSTSRFPWEANP
jgi:uncharacterized coiled-coil DUF342 family protein